MRPQGGWHARCYASRRVGTGHHGRLYAKHSALFTPQPSRSVFPAVQRSTCNGTPGARLNTNNIDTNHRYMKLRQRMALLAATAGALGWMALGAPSAQAQDKPPEAPAAAPAAPTPAAEAPKDAAAPAAAPADAAAPAATPAPPQPDSTATANNGGTGVDLQWPSYPAKTDPKTGFTTGEPTIDDAGKTTAGANSELVKAIAHNKISINISRLSCAFLSGPT